MTKENQIKLFREFVARMEETSLKKGDDYAGSDRLQNFKVAGAVANQYSTRATQLNCLNLIATKVARLGQLFNSKEGAKNESIDDSILDLAIYAFLLYCIENEGSEVRKYNHWVSLDPLK